MRTITNLICVLIVLLVNVGCNSDEETKTPKYNVNLLLDLPDGSTMDDISELKVTFTEENQKKKTDFTDLEHIVLPRGLYSVNVSCMLKVGVKHMVCTGLAQNINLIGDAQKLNIKIGAQSEARGFVIEEVFFASTDNGSTSPLDYTHDQYIKITNNGDQPLYADGLLIVQSELNTVKNDNLTPNDFIGRGFAVNSVYMIPGNGMEHKVNPGESIVIADQAYNFKKNFPASVDLSKANFEWYDNIETGPFSGKDIDTDAPNLIPVVTNGMSPWRMNNLGVFAIGLARVESRDVKASLDKMRQKYSYVRVLPNGRRIDINSNPIVLADNNVIDVVTLSVVSNYTRQVTPASMDKGYAYCSKVDKEPGYGKSIIRRLDKELTAKIGHRILVDTNNSGEDFDMLVPASLH